MFTPAAYRRAASCRTTHSVLPLRQIEFTALGGELVPYSVGQAALRSKQALLVGGLLVYGTTPG
ncbi:hypothetical protein [Hymenobacter metallilatus]|uniref:Uncharacterized protein n=1 Tax=Hymenobacter metallilatus TaxID=2493666 RepID=A0A3R9NKI6_9BACT|nr:hypothetical protein [Hymenobacter metallilatus]RSK35368.1 hypothetical protein EI290_06625 [Hymenobacter metallilatus]